jgi:hypothetical protein
LAAGLWQPRQATFAIGCLLFPQFLSRKIRTLDGQFHPGLERTVHGHQKNVRSAGKFRLLEDVGDVGDFRDFQILVPKGGKIDLFYFYGPPGIRA